jgi:hypothetical protein
VDGALSRLSYTHKGAMTNIIVGKEGNQAKYNRELVETDWCKNPDQFTPYNWGRSFQDEDAYAKDKEKITDVAVANQLKEGGVAGVPIPNANAELGGAELDRGYIKELGSMTPEIGDWIGHWWSPFKNLAGTAETSWASAKIISTRVAKGRLEYRCRYKTPEETVTNRDHVLDPKHYGVGDAGTTGLWVLLGKKEAQ